MRYESRNQTLDQTDMNQNKELPSRGRAGGWKWVIPAASVCFCFPPRCASTLLLSHEHHLSHSPPLLTHGPNQWNHDQKRQVNDKGSVGNAEDCDLVFALSNIVQNGKHKCGKYCCHGETHHLVIAIKSIIHSVMWVCSKHEDNGFLVAQCGKKKSEVAV